MDPTAVALHQDVSYFKISKTISYSHCLHTTIPPKDSKTTKNHTKPSPQAQSHSNESTWHDSSQTCDPHDGSSHHPNPLYIPDSLPTQKKHISLSNANISLTTHSKQKRENDDLPFKAHLTNDAVVVLGPKTNQFNDPATRTTTNGAALQRSLTNEISPHGRRVAAVKAARPTWQPK